jgi:hypothetical protein
VLELPLSDFAVEFGAMYRAIDHGHPTVNGNSGFEPPHYVTLRTALDERDPAAFDGLPSAGRILMVIDKRNQESQELDRFLAANPRVTRLPPDPRWAFYALQPPPAEDPPCRGLLPIVSIADAQGPVSLAKLTDHDPHTWWVTSKPQRVGDHLVIDLGRTAHPCAVLVAVGEARTAYPRKLVVETSVDGAAWTIVATRRTAGLTMKAALDDPKQVGIVIPMTSSAGRYVRLRIDETSLEVPWLVTEVAVRGAPTAE